MISTFAVDDSNTNVGAQNSIMTPVKYPQVLPADFPLYTLSGTNQSVFRILLCFRFWCRTLICRPFLLVRQIVEIQIYLKRIQGMLRHGLSRIYHIISTRWLWLEKCVNRELYKYNGLKCYFHQKMREMSGLMDYVNHLKI